jgi:hypothetical protein
MNAFNDTTVSPNTTYVYRVRAIDSTAVGPIGNADIATTMLFTNDPITPAVSFVRAIDFTELRAAVNAVRASAGLSSFAFTDLSLNSTMSIKAIHIVQLRQALDAARSALGLPAMVYTDPALAAGGRIKAAHVNDLRSGVK